VDYYGQVSVNIVTVAFLSVESETFLWLLMLKVTDALPLVILLNTGVMRALSLVVHNVCFNHSADSSASALSFLLLFVESIALASLVRRCCH
jgi:hypothetical protein